MVLFYRFCFADWTWNEKRENTYYCLLDSAMFVLLGKGELKARLPVSPVIGDNVYIHLVVALSILGEVANGFAVRLLVAVDPVEPSLLLLHLLLQHRGLQGGLCVRD